MVLGTEEFKEACKTILFSVDNKESSLFNETLEIIASGGVLNLNVTNREYYVSTKFCVDDNSELHASVRAELFLKLVSKITSEFIDISVNDNVLIIKGNGEYKIPLIYNDDVMLELPKIELKNITSSFTISSDILHSILNYNSKELTRGLPRKDVQKYYYVDDLGCITFMTGACVNNFSLPNKIKIIISPKVVKLFKLFPSDTDIDFSLANDEVENGVIQTKIRFKSDSVEISNKLPITSSSLISDVPVDSIRGLVNTEFPYSVVVDKICLQEVLDRMSLFTNLQGKNYGQIEVTSNEIKLTDVSGQNMEIISLSSECPNLESYSFIINLNNFKTVIDSCLDDYVTICFGDNRSVLIKKRNISELVPELHVR